MVNIMMIEADTAILQEVIMFLSGKGQCRITNLLLPEENGCVLSFPGLEIHLKEQMVYRDGVPVSMTYHEFFTLAYLAAHPGWVFSKAQIYESVWKETGGNCEGAVANVISQIRRKLNPDNPKESYIRTVVNSGYRFEADGTMETGQK